MTEYIEREAAIRKINGEFPDAHYPSWYAALIEEIPAADVVQVCRCRDCKNSRPLNRGDWFESLYGEDCIWCTHFGYGMRKTDFCSDGEKRC